MKYVRALASGRWATAPFFPPREWERTLVLVGEYGLWNVNRTPVSVAPGLIVGFNEAFDADFFLRAERGFSPTPEPGLIFVFHEDNDAQFFVNQGLAEFVTEEEVRRTMEERMEEQQSNSGDNDDGQQETIREQDDEGRGASKQARSKAKLKAVGGKGRR